MSDFSFTPSTDGHLLLTHKALPTTDSLTLKFIPFAIIPECKQFNFQTFFVSFLYKTKMNISAKGN